MSDTVRRTFQTILTLFINRAPENVNIYDW